MAPKRKSSSTSIGAPFYQLGTAASASKKRLFFESDTKEIDQAKPVNESQSSIALDIPAGYRTPRNRQNENISTTPISQLNSFLSGTHMSTSRRPSVQMNDITISAPAQKVPPPPPVPARPKTYLVIGASRGIGLEFARQLLTQHHQVIAVVRNPESASQLWQMTGQLTLRPGSCIIEQCDVSSPADIDAFVGRMRLFVDRGGSIDNIVLNAGILDYEKKLGSMDVSFEELDRHIRVNCVGNIVLARKLLALNELESLAVRQRQQLLLRSSGDDDYERGTVVGRQVVFMSSDSGSMADFREYEDGFAAYGASKAALNMMLRHMAAELKRKGQNKEREWDTDWQSKRSLEWGSGREKAWESEICVIAMHPGEVSTDMANVELGWEVEGVITAEESVRDMLRVLEGLKSKDSGTFWRWDGKVSCVFV